MKQERMFFDVSGIDWEDDQSIAAYASAIWLAFSAAAGTDDE